MLKHTHGKLPFYSYEVFQPFDIVTSVFSTRLGGVSEGQYHTLNLGMSVGDTLDNVIQNRTLFCEAIDLDIHAVTVGHLIQGTHIEIVSSAERGRGGVDRNTGLLGTDGMITNTPDVALLLLVADCAALSFF